MTRGYIQLLGDVSYAAPLLSTALLIAAGVAPFKPGIAVSTVLIAAGAALAASASAKGR